MSYIEYKFDIYPITPWREVLLALLSECEFESFVEHDAGLDAYVKKDQDSESLVQERIEILTEPKISYKRIEIEKKNWNEEWEKNFEPILVQDKCHIRAEFHDSIPNIAYEIIIQPKMSFGTGHHATTHLMVEYLLENDCSNKRVLDMGCGTSVLAILAMKKGAISAKGIDIDEWAVENSKENAQRNKVKIAVELGTADLLGKDKYELILANINKNILMADIPKYVSVLAGKGSSLVLSGLLDTDFDDIMAVCKENGLKFVSKTKRNEWIAIHFKK